MKRFVFEVIINEGNDEYWEDLRAQNKIGCEEILASIEEAMWEYFNDTATVTLKRYEDNADI